jgi:hypothetical protein
LRFFCLWWSGVFAGVFEIFGWLRVVKCVVKVVRSVVVGWQEDGVFWGLISATFQNFILGRNVDFWWVLRRAVRALRECPP